MALTEYEKQLLSGWEDIHKKSQLTLWVLLALRENPKHMAQIKTFMQEKTNNIIQADDKSMYRALRRFQDADLISYTERENPGGPKQKIFDLTNSGQAVLEQFIKRNIQDVFFNRDIQSLLITLPTTDS